MGSLTQKEIWEKIAKPWFEYRQEPLEEVLRFLKSKKGRILDLGCGSGRHLVRKLNTIFYEVDFSSSMLKYSKNTAKKKNINAEFIEASADFLPFESNFFDSAIFVAALHCIESEKQRIQSLKELFRVLKTGSEALITVWSKNHLRVKNKTKDSVVPWTFEGEKYQRYYYLYDKEELESLLKEVSFKIVSSKEDSKNISIIVKKEHNNP